MQSTPKQQINILFAAAEADPFVKVGGLADVAGTLPIKISEISKADPNLPKVDIRLVLPLHYSIKQKGLELQNMGTFSVSSASGAKNCELYVLNDYPIPVYFIDHEDINHGSPVYHADPTKDGNKYILFSIACLEMLKYLNWKADIIHSNDWHTATNLYALKTKYKKDTFFSDAKTVLTIHNLPFNGYGAQEALSNYGIKPAINKSLPNWAKHTPLPLGLLAADKIVAVSPNYAREILTPEFGCGLDEFLISRKDKVSGIINGIDNQIWNPKLDPLISFPFDQNSLREKIKNKLTLQENFGLTISGKIPLMVIVSRMDNQKGIDIVLDSIPKIKDENWQLIILGTGDPKLEKKAEALAKKCANKVVYISQFNAELAHQLYAGGDIYLMPSKYEPCGISQMIALNYGTIPVAHATGGLADTIVDYKHDNQKGNGFLFDEISVNTFIKALKQAIELFGKTDNWKRLIINGMKADFSWSQSAQKYLEMYQEIIS